MTHIYVCHYWRLLINKDGFWNLDNPVPGFPVYISVDYIQFTWFWNIRTGIGRWERPNRIQGCSPCPAEKQAAPPRENQAWHLTQVIRVMLCRFWANWDLDSWAQFAKNRPDKVKDKNPWRHVVTPCENFDRNELLQFYFGISFYVCPHYSCFAFYLWATNIFLLLHFICEAQYSSQVSCQFNLGETCPYLQIPIYDPIHVSDIW